MLKERRDHAADDAGFAWQTMARMILTVWEKMTTPAPRLFATRVPFPVASRWPDAFGPRNTR